MLPLQPRVTMLRFAKGSCGSPQVMDIWEPRHSYVGNRKITPNRTSPIVPWLWDRYHWNCILRSVTLQDSGWFGTDWPYCPGIYWVWHCPVAVASTWVVELLQPGVSLNTGENLSQRNKNCQTPSPQGQLGTFYFLLVQSFGHHLWPLHQPEGHYSTHRSPHYIYPTSLNW